MLAAKRGRVASLIPLLVLSLTLGAGVAQAELAVGESEGVRVTRERGAFVVTFTDRAATLYRRVAGKRVSVRCPKLPAPVDPALGVSSLRYRSRPVIRTAPKRRLPIRTGIRRRGADLCRVWLEARTAKRRGKRQREQRELIASVPLTQAGAVYLDEEDKARKIMLVITVAGIKAEKRRPHMYPSFNRLLPAKFRRLFGLVALTGPADTPEPGSTGYYTDGHQHVAAVALTASGRRIFFEAQGRDVLRTNIHGLLSEIF